MTLQQALAICKEMRRWRRSEFPYCDLGSEMPYSPQEYGAAVDVLIHLAERQVETEFKENPLLQPKDLEE